MYNQHQNLIHHATATRRGNSYDGEYYNSGLGDKNQSEDNMSNTSSSNAKQSLNTNNTRVSIFDRSAPDSKIAKKNKPILEKALFEMMYRELMSDSDIKPRFKKNVYVNGHYRAIAVGVLSAAFLKDRVEKMPPPWEGARLEVVYKGMQQNIVGIVEPKRNYFEPKRKNNQPQRTSVQQQRVHIEEAHFNVEAYVPGQLISTEYLFDVIRQFERNISTSNWQQYKVRPHGQGHVFTLNIDGESYHQLDALNGFIPYFNTGIEFRVLKDEYL